MKADIFSTDNSLIEPEYISKIINDKNTNNIQIIDVREPNEFMTGCIPGAKNMNVKSPDFSNRIGALDKNDFYLVYCQTGIRSAQAETKMRQAGFANIIQLNGGISAWKATNHNINHDCKS